MRQLRLAAQHKKLALSDAFEESCGKGLNAAMGEMAREAIDHQYEDGAISFR